MAKPDYYSPVLRRDIVTALYWQAKGEGIPMTHVADRLLRNALQSLQGSHLTPAAMQVCEEPITGK